MKENHLSIHPLVSVARVSFSRSLSFPYSLGLSAIVADSISLHLFSLACGQIVNLPVGLGATTATTAALIKVSLRRFPW